MRVPLDLLFKYCMIIVWGFAHAPAIGQTAAPTPSSAPADLDQLTQKVSALPEGAPWEKLKKATLEWALEDAKAASEQ